MESEKERIGGGGRKAKRLRDKKKRLMIDN
jgi:hypothetical protein